MKRIDQDIQTGKFKPAYLIYGPEDFLRKQCKIKFRDALAGDNALNYSYWEGPSVPEDEVRLLAGTIPFMAEKRLILLENTGWAKKGAEGIAGDIATLPESTVLVFVERESDGKSPLFKAIQKAGCCILCDVPAEGDLRSSVRAAFEREGYQIDSPALQLFLERCGGDMNRIAGEKEKLLAYGRDSRHIRREDVEQITHQTLQERIFNLMDAVALRQTRQAFRYYEELRGLKEPPIRILSRLSGHIRNLYLIREMDEKQLGAEAIQTATGLHPYVVKKGLHQSRSLHFHSWKAKWEACLAYEYAIKSGKMSEEIAVEMALLEMCLS